MSSSIMIMLATFHAVFLHGKFTFSSHPRPTIAISDQKTRMLLLFLRSVPTHKKVLIHTRLRNVRTPDFLPPSAICTFHPIFFLQREPNITQSNSHPAGSEPKHNPGHKSLLTEPRDAGGDTPHRPKVASSTSQYFFAF